MSISEQIKNEALQELLSDTEIETAFHGTNFGNHDHREVLADTLLKIAGDFHSGHTSMMIVQYLGLASRTKKGWKLTKKGRRYMFWSYTRD